MLVIILVIGSPRTLEIGERGSVPVKRLHTDPGSGGEDHTNKLTIYFWDSIRREPHKLAGHYSSRPGPPRREEELSNKHFGLPLMALNEPANAHRNGLKSEPTV